MITCHQLRIIYKYSSVCDIFIAELIVRLVMDLKYWGSNLWLNFREGCRLANLAYKSAKIGRKPTTNWFLDLFILTNSLHADIRVDSQIHMLYIKVADITVL